jgi:hypothetical protein
MTIFARTNGRGVAPGTLVRHGSDARLALAEAPACPPTGFG